jgi:hypothetical protein
MISLWLWPLLALGADIESSEKPRVPNPLKPTLFEIEGDYGLITKLYGKKYCLARIVILATKVKKHIEATIPDPIQQNLRWRYITWLASSSRWNENDFNQPYELATIFEKFSESQPDWLWPTIHAIGGLINAFNEEHGRHWENTPPIVATMTPKGIFAVQILDRSVFMALYGPTNGDCKPVPADQKKANILLSAPGKPLEAFNLPIPLEILGLSTRRPQYKSCFAIISEEVTDFESLVVSYHGTLTKGTFSIDIPYSEYTCGSHAFSFHATWVQKPADWVPPGFELGMCRRQKDYLDFGPDLEVDNGGAILESALRILAGEIPKP